MTTTRRLSSLQGQGQSHQQTSLLLDSYETFKRKHIQQNKEIISKNSELNKEKADLQSQISLMRVERLSLMGSNLKLNIQLEAVRKRLERALEREHDLVRERDRLKKQQLKAAAAAAASVDPEQVEIMQQALVNAIAALQAFGLALPATGPGSAALSSSLRSSSSGKARQSDASVSSAAHLPSSPPASPPAVSSELGDLEPEQGTSSSGTGATSRRASLADRGPRQSICVSPPDLSNIDEADASDEERETQEEEAQRRAAWEREQQRFEPILQQLPSLARAPSPPRTVAPPTPSTSSSSAPSAHTATALARPASRGPRAPPKAPSASSHSTLGNASTLKRPARRVSGMLKPSLAVEFGEDDGGVEEEESAVSTRNMDVSDDSADESVAVISVPPTTARSRRRVSSIGLDAAPTPASFATRTRVTRSTSPAADDLAPPQEVEPAPVPRPALRETQPKAAVPSDALSSISATTPTNAPTAKEKVVERMKRRTTRVPAIAAAEVEAETEAAQQQQHSAAVLASLSRGEKAARRRREAENDDEEEVEAAEEARDGEEVGVEVEEAHQAGRGESGGEPADSRTDAQHETEDTREAADAAEEEAAAGGRRARKSVNYALPKLNTKMRRPEDYVPVKPGASKPRKSSRPTSTAPRTSELPPAMPAAPSVASDSAPAPTPRPASLAGKKPPPDSLAKLDENGDSVARSQHSAVRAAASNPSTSTIRQDLEARRKQRQAEREQLAKLGSSGGDLASRRPVTAAV